jgi:hypothetical protein
MTPSSVRLMEPLSVTPRRVFLQRMGLIVPAVAALTLAACSASPSGYSKSSQGDAGAYNACKTYVKGQLKAPSTASFADHSVTHNGSTYTVTGAVDAENSFGAKIRNTYTCSVTDAGSSWHLEDVSVAAP